jgi:hypothetical protein
MTLQEKFFIWIAWILPRELVSHVFARVVANATRKHPDKTPGEIAAMDALHDWIYKGE